jgi:hypothetical protein
MAVEEYNRRAVAALRRAQQMSHAPSANAFARMIAARADGSPSGTSYRRWVTGEAVVPAWALEAAAEVAGVSLPGLLSDDGQLDEGASPEWRTEMEDRIGRLQAEIIELRERVGLPEARDSNAEERRGPAVRPSAAT